MALITDFIMAGIFHNLIFWFIREKLLFMASRSRRGFFGISCKTHFKVLWVLLLTLIYTVNQIMYQLVNIIKEISYILSFRDLEKTLPFSYFKCDYLARIMLNVSMPVIDFLMALSLLYFCFH